MTSMCLIIPTQSYYSTDFMGDMAFVSQCVLRWSTANLICLRFGGSFEMMKAGGDVDGVWTLFGSSMWYVTWALARECNLCVMQLSTACLALWDTSHTSCRLSSQL